MFIRVVRLTKWIAMVSLLGVLPVTLFAQDKGFNDEPEKKSPGTGYTAPRVPTGDEIIAKVVESSRVRNAQLRRYSAVRTYEIRNSEGKLAAQSVVRVQYQAPEEKTFNKSSEQGSGIVRHLVFDRLMQSESETSAGKERHDSAITAANYVFTFAGEEEVGDYHCFVLEAAPKRKDKYLFEGKVWIDAQDFAIVKIAGHPAKKPSFWINKADFVRQYQRIDGFWVPRRDETTVEVKVYGRRLFTVDHQQYEINRGNPLQANREEDRNERFR